MEKLTVEQWKELFAALGLQDSDMQKWHRLFEAKYPAGHQSFLEWLGVDRESIKTIRAL